MHFFDHLFLLCCALQKKTIKTFLRFLQRFTKTKKKKRSFDNLLLRFSKKEYFWKKKMIHSQKKEAPVPPYHVLYTMVLQYAFLLNGEYGPLCLWHFEVLFLTWLAVVKLPCWLDFPRWGAKGLPVGPPRGRLLETEHPG